MAIDLTTGSVINGTIATVRENGNIAVAYVSVMSFLGLLLEWGLPMAGLAYDTFDVPSWLVAYLGVSAGIGGLLFLILLVVANYMLWEFMLRQANLVREGGRRFFRYVGQAILIAIFTAIGFVLIIVPGLIISARLSAAPAFLIGEKRGAIESIGESWEMVRGNTTPIVLAYLVGVLIFLVLAGLLAGFGFASSGVVGPVMVFLQQIVSNLATVFTVALGIFVYSQLSGATAQVAEVFE